MHADPRTSKALLAKAAACEAGVLFLKMPGSEFMEMSVGAVRSGLHALFAQAR